MNYRKLGKTGLMVSEIGFGGEWLERHDEAESVELVRGILLLQLVEEAADDVVTARCLAAAEDDAQVDGLVGLCLVRRHKLHEGHTVGVGELGTNLVLVAHTLRRFALAQFYIPSQSEGQLGLIGSPSLL